MSEEITNEQWQAAKEHFDEVMQAYKELLGTPGVMVAPALMMFEADLRRYNSGERSRELYDDMMEAE